MSKKDKKKDAKDKKCKVVEEEEEINNNEGDEEEEDIYNNEELIFDCINRVKEDGIPVLLQYLNNISVEQLTSPSFINKLEDTLKDDKSLPLRDLLRNNYPSNSLILLEYLKNLGINIKQLICSPHIYISVLNSSLNLYGNVKENVMLKNKKEEKAQLELVKMILELSLFDIEGFGETIMRDVLESRNLKIIKYFVSLNITDFKMFSQYYNERDALHIALQPIWCNLKYSIDKEQQNSLLKLIKYLVDQGVDIHQPDEKGATILHPAAKYHSLKIIKYLVSLGIDIHSLDNQNNTLLLSAFYRKYFIKDLEYYEILEKMIKYFISIGVNIDHQKSGMDVLLYSIECGSLELIKYISSSISPLSLKSPDRYIIKSDSFQNAISCILRSFNIEIIKYLDEIPCFANYFDGQNKIRSKNYILFHLTSFYVKDVKREITFKQFKEVFEFFLSKRNNINCITSNNRISIQHDNYKYFYNNCWKYWDYLIEKGINLNHLSNNGSILHDILEKKKTKIKNQEYGKYIMIRSMEINSQIVDHPKFCDLRDEDTFEDFKRKDGEEGGEERLIKWKRGMREILTPNILNIVSPSDAPCKFKFDENSSQFVIL